MSDLLLSNRVLAIVGPTATGKSGLALHLAEEICRQDKAAGVTIISADSRQVYQGMEICTGADIPDTWETTTQFATSGYRHPEFPIFLCGIAAISPLQEWSVTHFRQYALSVVAESLSQGHVVLLVGGTGMYHEHLFSTDALLDIPPNPELRKATALLTLEQLQAEVQSQTIEGWQQMNESDRQNPRRLIRALEKAEQKEPLSSAQLPFSLAAITHITVGLRDTPERLSERIASRVQERFQAGVVAEVEKLVATYDEVSWKLPAFSSTGCKEVRMYLDEKITIEELKELWHRRELQYAKRQLTWWKAHPYATSVEGFAAKTKQWIDLSTVDPQDWQTEIIQSCILGLC